MARAKPSNPQPQPSEDGAKPQEQVIEYFGDGAEKVKFEIDPKATRIRVYADGRILIDY